MIDLGQAERDLRKKISAAPQYKIWWPQAMLKAAQAMGYKHYMDVPDTKECARIAKEIQIAGGLEK